MTFALRLQASRCPPLVSVQRLLRSRRSPPGFPVTVPAVRRLTGSLHRALTALRGGFTSTHAPAHRGFLQAAAASRWRLRIGPNSWLVDRRAPVTAHCAQSSRVQLVLMSTASLSRCSLLLPERKSSIRASFGCSQSAFRRCQNQQSVVSRMKRLETESVAQSSSFSRSVNFVLILISSNRSKTVTHKASY